jgi:hypothetical protein
VVSRNKKNIKKMNKCIVIKNFIREDICKEMSNQMRQFDKSGLSLKDDPLCPDSASFYRMFDKILALCHPRVEEIVGEELIPSFNYCRVYKKNNILPRHIDRPACEISFTITLDYEISPWLFYAEVDGKEIEVNLKRGDMCLYEGCIIPHWRHQMTHQTWQSQGFFHYVRKNGLFADHGYDKDQYQKAYLRGNG